MRSSISFIQQVALGATLTLLFASAVWAQETEMMTTEEKNKKLIRYVVAEGVNKGDLDVFREVLAENYVRHSQATSEMPEMQGVDTMLTFLEGHYRAFPDWQEKIDLMIAEGNIVAYITTGTGTHTGPMGDMPPTGKEMTVTNYVFQRIQDGKIVETWVGWDNLAGLAQLGLFPPPKE